MIDREEMIRLLKERIEWLENNPDGEEFNVHELAAAKDYLAKLDPPELNLEEGYYAEEKSLERFWKSLDARAEFDEERQKFLAGEARKILPVERTEEREDVPVGERGKAEPSADQKKTGSIFLYFAYHRGMAACAVVAVLVLAMLAGGTAGAYAQSRGGIFHFLKNDEEGMEVLISQDGVEVDDYQHYISLDELSEEYKGFYMFPDKLQGKYVVDHINVSENSKYVWFETIFIVDDSDEYIECTQVYFKKDFFYFKLQKDSYSFLESQEINGVNIDFYYSEDIDDEKYVSSFVMDKSIFTINGSVSYDGLIKLSEEIIQFMKKKV